MELGQAYVQIVPSAKGISGGISKALDGEAASAGKSSGEALGGNLVSTIKKVVVAAGIGAAIKSSLDAGGALQQSFGGLDTLYGEAAGKAKEYAKEAAKAGISANDFAEQAVSFGASLKQAYGGDMTAAVEAANTAILDMADNSAKMGTDIGAIQTAYQGFAKQNYTMLDNLKLGYGGTKTEMERLLADAEKFSGIKYDIDNLGDVYSAIHVIQENLKLTGVAADEAAETFSGSFNAMKAAAENLKADIALGMDPTDSLNMLMTNASNFLTKNLLPMVGNIFKGLPQIITTALNGLSGALSIDKGSITVMAKQGVEIVTGLAEAILTGIPVLIQAFFNLITNAFSALTSVSFIVPAQNMILRLKENLLAAAQSMLGVDDSAGIMGAITSGITSAIPNFFASVLPIISGFSEWLLANSGTFLQAGIDIIMSIVDGIVQSIPILVSQVPQIVTNFANVINNNAPTVLRAGMDIIVKLGKGIIDNIPVIVANAGQIVQAIFAVIQAVNWLALGTKIITLLANGIKGMIPAIVNTAKSLGNGVINAIKTMDWLGLGRNIITGIITGLKNMGSAFTDALISLAKNAFTGILGYFGIDSPSKLMRDEVGRYIPLGIAEGILGSEAAVTDAMHKIAQDTAAINFGALGMSAGASYNGELLDRLENISVNANVTLQGDARKIFKVVRKDNSTLSRATGYNLLGGYT